MFRVSNGVNKKRDSEMVLHKYETLSHICLTSVRKLICHSPVLSRVTQPKFCKCVTSPNKDKTQLMSPHGELSAFTLQVIKII